MRLILSSLLSNSFRFRTSKYFLLAILISPLVHQAKTYASAKSPSSNQLEFFVSPETAIFFLIGIIVSLFYIKGMAGVLSNAVRTYNADVKNYQDAFTGGITNTLLAVIASAVIIWSYGLGSYWFYLGPVLCLLSPIGIIYFMFLDIKAYKQSP